MVDSDRNEGKDYFEINRETGEIFTKVMFDREKQGAYALEVEARDGAPSARPNSNGQPNSGTSTFHDISPHAFDASFKIRSKILSFDVESVWNSSIKSGGKFPNFVFFRIGKIYLAEVWKSKQKRDTLLRVKAVSMLNLKIDSLVNAW